MSDLVLGSTTVLSDSSGTPTIQSGVAFPSGHVIQTLGVIKTDTSLMNTTAAIPGLAVDITVKKTSSKMLIYCTICFGRQNGNSAYPFQIFRDSAQSQDLHPLKVTNKRVLMQ